MNSPSDTPQFDDCAATPASEGPELSPLARKVRDSVSGDGALQFPAYRTWTEEELNWHDWFLLLGIAYGIARGENPYESAEAVSQRAWQAAREVWPTWLDPDFLAENLADAVAA